MLCMWTSSYMPFSESNIVGMLVWIIIITFQTYLKIIKAGINKLVYIAVALKVFGHTRRHTFKSKHVTKISDLMITDFTHWLKITPGLVSSIFLSHWLLLGGQSSFSGWDGRSYSTLRPHFNITSLSTPFISRYYCIFATKDYLDVLLN